MKASEEAARLEAEKVAMREAALQAQIQEAEEASRQAAEKAELAEKAFRAEKELEENRREMAEIKKREAIAQQQALNGFESVLLAAGRFIAEKCSIM